MFSESCGSARYAQTCPLLDRYHVHHNVRHRFGDGNRYQASCSVTHAGPSRFVSRSFDGLDVTLRKLSVARGRGWILFSLLTCLTACTSNRSHEPQVIPPSTVVSEKTNVSRPIVALVLGGGALRGFAHVGVIKTLEAHAIRPDLIVGTSAGSLVGALYASGFSAIELENIAFELERANLVDYSFLGFGFIKGEALQEFVNERLNGRPIESLKIPFAAVATDFQTGQVKVFNRGNTGMAVRASSSIPGVFHPVIINGQHYVDGSLASPIPVCVARQLGADFVIAVDVWYIPQDTPIHNLFNTPFQMFHIMARALSAHQINAADVAIKPNFAGAGEVSFSNKQALIQAGEVAALDALAEIKMLLAVKMQPSSTKVVANGCPPIN